MDWTEQGIIQIRRKYNIRRGLYPTRVFKLFFNDDELSEMESEITSFCSSHKYVLLSGDFNARTAELRDFTECDNFLADLFDFDNDTINFFSVAYNLPDYNILQDRKSTDNQKNNNGNKLIDLCKNHNL